MKLKNCAVALCSLAILTALPACKTKSGLTTYHKIYHAMNTTATLVCSADIEQSVFDEFSGKVQKLLSDAEGSLSTRIETSSISAFNSATAGSKVELDKTAYDALKCAQSVYIKTEGAYNPAVYYSAVAYGFYDAEFLSEGFSVPDANGEEIKAYSSLASHFAEIVLSEEEGKYYAVKPQYTEGDLTLKIDLGGIGKGLCADMVDGLFDEYGIEYGYFNFGSSSIGFKKYNGQNTSVYKLSARDPQNAYGQPFYEIEVQGEKLSTSGDYEQFYYVKDGKVLVEKAEGAEKYCHIINPFTGAPIRTGISSVTIIGGAADEDDALTTALSVMGKQRAVEFINAHLKDKKVIMLVFEEGEGKIITNCPQEITVLNAAYKLANRVEDGRIILN